MKKVLLINTNTEHSPYPVPPVGICLLATRLEKTYEVRVFDGAFEDTSRLVDVVTTFQPDYIGFSIRNIDDIVADRHTYYIDPILTNFIKPVRKITRVPVILGGSGFSMFSEELMQLSGADFGIVGDALQLFPELLAALDQEKSRITIPRILSAQNQNSPEGRKSDDRLRISAFSNIDRWIDFTPYRRRGAYSIQTKRGCSHRCIYCTYPVIEGKKFITRSASEIADEIMEASERLGDVMFEFVDSTFNDPPNHAENICREIIKRKMKVRLRTMGINPKHTSEELFELMLEAGFTQIDATPDTASEVMLKNMGKGFTLSEVVYMATLIRKFRIPTMWFFLFGGPGETTGTFRETIDFIDQHVSEEDLVYMTAGLRIYPGTPLHESAISEGRIARGSSLLYPPQFYYSKDLGKDQLNALIREAEGQRLNCIPALESHPPPAMIEEAMEIRNHSTFQEPMFRTLLRVRRDWRKRGLI
jgi:radical SAM superfamily enzyme YgiQ (UPF0313 family)